MSDDFLEGMGKTHEIVWDTINKLQGSISDVQSIYGRMHFQTIESSLKLNELQQMWETLEAFRDMFTESYDSVIDEAKQ